MSKRKRLLIEIDPDFHYRLFIKARQERVNVSELVRGYLRQWIENPDPDAPLEPKHRKE